VLDSDFVDPGLVPDFGLDCQALLFLPSLGLWHLGRLGEGNGDAIAESFAPTLHSANNTLRES
jgi:hypothetical protein